MIGEKILERYLVRELLGEGSMGDVYKAYDERLRCDVALKFLPETHRFDEKARAHFLREARALARTNHPNICNVRDFVDYQGTEVLVMEYVEVTLSRRLSEGPLEEHEIVRLGIQLAEGLGAAHQAGVLHRDLKPGNLGVTPDGRLKILDFGLAKMIAGTEESPLSLSTSDEFTVKGTLPYIAPEILRGGKPDPRSDLFSAGCVLYEMATARRAFPQDDGLTLWHGILNLDPTPPREIRPQLSAGLERVIVQCLAKDPAQRYGAMSELVLALRRIRRWGFLPLLPAWLRRSVLIAGVAMTILLLLWTLPGVREPIRRLWTH